MILLNYLGLIFMFNVTDYSQFPPISIILYLLSAGYCNVHIKKLLTPAYYKVLIRMVEKAVTDPTVFQYYCLKYNSLLLSNRNAIFTVLPSQYIKTKFNSQYFTCLLLFW